MRVVYASSMTLARSRTSAPSHRLWPGRAARSRCCASTRPAPTPSERSAWTPRSRRCVEDRPARRRAGWPALAGADVVHTHDRGPGCSRGRRRGSRGAASVHTLHGVPEELCVRVGRDDDARSARCLARTDRLAAARDRPDRGAAHVPGHRRRPVTRARARFSRGTASRRRRMHVIPYGVEPQPVGAGAAGRARRASAPPPTSSTTRASTSCSPRRRASRRRFSSRSTATARPRASSRRRPLGSGSTRASTDSSPSSGRIRELDVFVLPTRGDNLPVSILEAMANAVPVISTRVGGSPGAHRGRRDRLHRRARRRRRPGGRARDARGRPRPPRAFGRAGAAKADRVQLRARGAPDRSTSTSRSRTH